MKNSTNKILKAFLPLVVLLSFTTGVFCAGDEWGLGGYGNGKQPSGNQTPEYLRQFDTYYVGDSNQKTIFLTFDCGYENGQANKILDTLKKENVPAAFFVVGPYIKENPAIIKRMVDEGHIVANHTMHHPNVREISKERFTKEIKSVEELYTSVTGQQIPKFYRPPQGKYSEENLTQAKEMGYKTIYWSLAHVDWYPKDQPTKEKAFKRLIPNIHPGAIVLLHIVSKTNADILDELIQKYRAEGYQFKSLYELP